MILRSFLRVRTLFAALLLVIFLFWTILRHFEVYIPDLSSPQAITDLTPSHRQFWHEFHALLEEYAPDTEPIIEYERASTEGFNVHNAPPRPDALYVPDEDITTIKKHIPGSSIQSLTPHPISPTSREQKA